MAHTDEDVTAGLLALIATGGNAAEAVKILKGQDRKVPATTLRRWATDVHVVQYEKLREEWAPKIEARLANELLDNARLAAETERLAIEKSREQLESGKAAEPSRIARDLSQVKAQSVDKRLALQGRPTQITERRDVSEILNALVGMKVAVAVDSDEQRQLAPADG